MKKLFISSLTALMLLAGCQQTPQVSVQPQPPVQPSPTTVQPTPPASTEQETQPTEETKIEASSGRMMKPVGDFHFDEKIATPNTSRLHSDYIGTLYLEGMAKVVQVKEGFCEENCKQFDYVLFQFTPEYDAENKDFQAFMKMNTGKTWSGDNAVGIGCLEEHGIRRRFEGGPVEGATINQTDSEKIINSSEEAPVLLKLTKGFVPGSGAPDCYSHFSGVELVTIADNV